MKLEGGVMFGRVGLISSSRTTFSQDTSQKSSIRCQILPIVSLIFPPLYIFTFHLPFCRQMTESRDVLLCLPFITRLKRNPKKIINLLIGISSPLCLSRRQVKRKPQRCHLKKSPVPWNSRSRNRLLHLPRNTQELHTMV